MKDYENKILLGNVLDVLPTIPDETIDCVVTSPPYYGLRDYGVDGQIGLEETPEAFVEKMVLVFREVRRVLKKEGTLWLNLGDTYAANRGGTAMPAETLAGGISGRGDIVAKRGRESGYTPHRNPASHGLKHKDLMGIPWRVAFALQQPYETHLVKSAADRAYLAGLVDGEGCITILRTKSSHCDSYSHPPIVQVRMCDVESIDYFATLIEVNRSEAELYNSQKNANQRPSYTVKATAQKAMDLIADIYPYLHVKRKQAVVAYNHQLWRAKTNYQERGRAQLEREEFCKKLINDLNQRVNRDIPDWMIEPQFKSEPGWYLRQDCIWHKPNPMPESVTDRCTKAHEYIFLLSKSAKYYYDAEAIKEPVAESTVGRGPVDFGGAKGRRYKENISESDPNYRAGSEQWGRTFDYAKSCATGRNKRSVWTVTTKPFSGAHFATFPEDLIQPCILAGCPENGLILDPFFGAGTTGLVAYKNKRNYVGCELNPEYIAIAEARLQAERDKLSLFEGAK